ncbi:hypothetical protein LZ32DRAFT_600665 [Colletotrichum eremochloae]|nr:hypothetical protein LZ32DRAFT_600665 [Colletotrichum eremochloae]
MRIEGPDWNGWWMATSSVSVGWRGQSMSGRVGNGIAVAVVVAVVVFLVVFSAVVVVVADTVARLSHSI